MLAIPKKFKRKPPERSWDYSKLSNSLRHVIGSNSTFPKTSLGCGFKHFLSIPKIGEDDSILVWIFCMELWGAQLVGSWKTTFLLERPIFRCYVSGRVRDPAYQLLYIKPIQTLWKQWCYCPYVSISDAWLPTWRALTISEWYSLFQASRAWYRMMVMKSKLRCLLANGDRTHLDDHLLWDQKITWHHGDQSTMCWTFHFHRVAQTSEDPYTATVCFHRSTIFMLHHPRCDPEVGWSIAV